MGLHGLRRAGACSPAAGCRNRSLPTKRLCPPHALGTPALHAGKRAPLYVKSLAVGDQLLVHWVAGAGLFGAGGSSSAAKEPQAFELDTSAYTTDALAAPACYKDMGGLVGKLRCVGGFSVCVLLVVADCQPLHGAVGEAAASVGLPTALSALSPIPSATQAAVWNGTNADPDGCKHRISRSGGAPG